jgi:hypothetical protein
MLPQTILGETISGGLHNIYSWLSIEKDDSM